LYIYNSLDEKLKLAAPTISKLLVNESLQVSISHKNSLPLCFVYLNMKKITFIILAFVTFASNAQKVFAVQYENQADVKVFVVKYENQADLKIYKVKYENQAGKNNGAWFFTKYKNQSKKKIYFVTYENQADLKIYVVKYKNQAGWREKSKQHLML
jgi:hypothetical protein